MRCVALLYAISFSCFGIGNGQLIKNGGTRQNTMTSPAQTRLQHSLRMASFLQNSVRRGNMMAAQYWMQQRVTGVPNAALLVVLKGVNPDIVAENVTLKQVFCRQCHLEGNYVCATMYCGPE